MEIVCVTGAGGYVASWVVKEVLAKGYFVHGTVRDLDDEKKNGHLKKLKHAEEKLHLFKADMLDYASLCTAMDRCTGVVHVASPVPAGKAEMFEPVITGTRNVMNACLNTKVNKVVIVSSLLAIVANPSWPKNQVMDENCWTDVEFCMKNEKWYCAAKTISEREALEFGKKNNIKVVTVCPSLVFGPMLQSTICTTNLVLLNLFKGENSFNLLELNAQDDIDIPIVDVRDCANALLLAYEKAEADGRYLCSSHTLKKKALTELLNSLFPHYIYPTNCYRASDEKLNYTCEKLVNLGWNHMSLEKTLVDSVRTFQKAGLLS
ncbi:NAD-dependent epimerase/dehydratase [Cynara cardunculus var. scolymus]|uniref:Dihydroflavonol 4-reductase n=1 Tax=Cynara cardunculus var. scolymus TaxID=59895 RepID=A0A103Y9T3_CYNCS|nr:NAD-dependent epimerase/dehydratase [Cynara cardunculus var. scolymus]